jgi:DNA-binding response OmpR family regulator
VAEPVRVLVVEDEPKLAGMLRRGLTEEGDAVDVAITGRAQGILLYGPPSRKDTC